MMEGKKKLWLRIMRHFLLLLPVFKTFFFYKKITCRDFAIHFKIFSSEKPPRQSEQRRRTRVRRDLN